MSDREVAEGPSIQIKLADNFAVAAVVPTELDKVAAGTFIAPRA